MLQIRWNSQNCEGITNHYVQRINLKRDKCGELGGKGLIVFPVFRFTLALASRIFFSKFQSVIASNAKADKRRIWSAFAAVRFCKFKPASSALKLSRTV